MEVLDWLLVALIVGCLLYPLGFCFYHNVPNKVFFLSSIIGVSFVIHMLVTIVVSPITFILIKVVPQLAENDVVSNILPLLWLFDTVQEYYFIFFTLILSVVLPHLIRKRYAIFT